MFLRTSISNTKKFFQKSIDNFKSLLSGGYQKLPKNPPCKPFSCYGLPRNNSSLSYAELEKVFTDFSNYGENEKTKKKMITKEMMSMTLSRQDNEVRDEFKKHAKDNSVAKHVPVQTRSSRKQRKMVVSNNSSGLIQRSRSNYLVAQKLKELEMIDKSNVEHVLDIEEVIHYYSRLTCPDYREIVDKFFMDMYPELFRAKQ